MTRAGVRAGVRTEKRVVKVLGGRRPERERYESAPDIVGVPGWLPEVKYRRRLPRLVVEALRQAEGYAILGQKPVAVLFERGSRTGLAVLRLDDFAEMVKKPASTMPVCTCALCLDERARGERP